jgi:hypothetical protein
MSARTPEQTAFANKTMLVAGHYSVFTPIGHFEVVRVPDAGFYGGPPMWHVTWPRQQHPDAVLSTLTEAMEMILEDVQEVMDKNNGGLV